MQTANRFTKPNGEPETAIDFEDGSSVEYTGERSWNGWKPWRAYNARTNTPTYHNTQSEAIHAALLTPRQE